MILMTSLPGEDDDVPAPSLKKRPVYDSSDEEVEEHEQPAPKLRRLPHWTEPRPAPKVSVPSCTYTHALLHPGLDQI